MRDEQVAEYPQRPGFPDMNPRGCQKGAVYCSWIKQPDFLKYPLKRGPGNICMPKRPFAVITNNAYTRLANLLGAIKPDVSSMTGDLYPGIHAVRIPARTVSTFDDWFTSDRILMWYKNPIVTRQPDAHFLMEARYNGARLVNISADYTLQAHCGPLRAPGGLRRVYAHRACRFVTNSEARNDTRRHPGTLMKLPIYLDYNATTPVAAEVADAIEPFLRQQFGNPSSSHRYGIQAREAVERARARRSQP